VTRRGVDKGQRFLRPEEIEQNQIGLEGEKGKAIANECENTEVHTQAPANQRTHNYRAVSEASKSGKGNREKPRTNSTKQKQPKDCINHPKGCNLRENKESIGSRRKKKGGGVKYYVPVLFYYSRLKGHSRTRDFLRGRQKVPLER